MTKRKIVHIAVAGLGDEGCVEIAVLQDFDGTQIYVQIGDNWPGSIEIPKLAKGKYFKHNSKLYNLNAWLSEKEAHVDTSSRP